MSIQEQMEMQEALELVERQHEEHDGEWLTMKDAVYYREAGKQCGSQNRQKLRKLQRELRVIFGVTELEAINIVNGFYLQDYVNKYQRIKNKIPLDVTVRIAAEAESEAADDEFSLDEYREKFGVRI